MDGDANSFVNWRNRVFGHGVFKQERQWYAEQTLNWLPTLHEFYQALHPVLNGWVLTSITPSGEEVIWQGAGDLPYVARHPHEPWGEPLPMFLNYSIILGKFSYDPRDGEVNFAINVPVDENTFTYEQFEHCLRVMALSVDKYTPIFKAIVAGTKPLEEFLKEEMGGAEGLIRTLREFLEMLERSVGEGSKREEEEPLEEV